MGKNVPRIGGNTAILGIGVELPQIVTVIPVVIVVGYADLFIQRSGAVLLGLVADVAPQRLVGVGGILKIQIPFGLAVIHGNLPALHIDACAIIKPGVGIGNAGGQRRCRQQPNQQRRTNERDQPFDERLSFHCMQSFPSAACSLSLTGSAR